jgi:hypothetical protein
MRKLNNHLRLSENTISNTWKNWECFHTKDIEAAIEKARKYNSDVIGSSYFTSKSMGIYQHMVVQHLV